ncbi:MAG: hypothetical protein HY263_04360 [Chloroflexi bacterium]|nr:hypothetical protein [Chloroflexota bacterium]
MTGPELATLSTIGWIVLTLAFIVVFGTWSAGGSWSILPGLVRGVRDWATEEAVARQPSSPSPWAVTAPTPALPVDPTDKAAIAAPEIEELWIRPTSR